jgi:DNA-binding transcriptional ArsR family regulator
MEQVGSISESGRLDAVFAALAHPARRALLKQLAVGEAPLNRLAEPFDMTQTAISKHLRVLEHAGLVTRRIDRQRRPARLNPEPLVSATAWLEEFRALWSARLDQLDILLAEMRRDIDQGNPDG